MQTVQKNISSTDTRTAAIKPLRILMAAGGTGGHVYPAIAIADALNHLDEKSSFLFVGTKNRMEWQTVPRHGYSIKGIWISGIHRRLTVQNLLFPIKLLVSLLQSFIIIREFKPDAVVACGGFACGPIGWVAAKTGIPLMLQEQNSYPGVTNRMLAKHASLIFTAFEEAANYLPAHKIELTGNPVRSAIQQSDEITAVKTFGFSSEKPVLLVLGGSGGARAINEIMLAELPRLHNSGIQMIWQCGQKYLDGLKSRINESEFPNLRLRAFLHDMPKAYGAASLVVTRAGAGTCSELMNIGKPAILIPSPNVAGDHQTKNAKSLANIGAAYLMKETQLRENFYTTVTGLIHDEPKLLSMAKQMKSIARPNAAAVIAQRISTYISNAL